VRKDAGGWHWVSTPIFSREREEKGGGDKLHTASLRPVTAPKEKEKADRTPSQLVLDLKKAKEGEEGERDCPGPISG